MKLRLTHLLTRVKSTAPKCHGDPILFKMGTQWGPNFEWDGDLMGTFASTNGDPKSVLFKTTYKFVPNEILQELKKELKAEAMISVDHEKYGEKLKRIMVRVTGKHGLQGV